ncbi:AMP-binding enzyme domain-containing protein [Cladophialophora immunda]|nr:AMP-binding enzyme domain-containing protein [Cladophialophora immunda]
MLFLGIIAAGAIFAGTNPAYTHFELAHHFKTSRTMFVIAEPDLLQAVVSAAQECDIPQSRIWAFDSQKEPIPTGFASWRELLKHGQRDWIRFNDEQVSKRTTAARLFSSGTTGLPKAAALSHYNLIAQHTLVNETQPTPYEPRRLLYLPLFHAAMVPVAHVTPLRSGDLSYILRRFEMEPFLASIQQYQLTEMVFVPPVAVAVLKYPLLHKYSLKSIKVVVCGAGPLDKEHQNALQVILGPETSFTQVWGMTETSCVASKFYYPERDDTGSVGHMMPNLDVKLIDDNGNDITTFDVPGELCIRGPTIISGYFNSPHATKDSIDEEGYFKTGDVMYCDSKTKKWYIIDRKKELIKVRGFQVAPAEIEGVLLSHPEILDAAVIGIRKHDEADVELPKAYIVRKPGSDNTVMTEEMVKSFCRERLAKYKELSGGVSFIDAIPRNATGKALKRILREMAKVENGNPSRL